jgi:hypothetical protein
MSLDALPVVEPVPVVEERPVAARPLAADEPLTQEREAVPADTVETRDRVVTTE